MSRDKKYVKPWRGQKKWQRIVLLPIWVKGKVQWGEIKFKVNPFLSQELPLIKYNLRDYLFNSRVWISPGGGSFREDKYGEPVLGLFKLSKLNGRKVTFLSLWPSTTQKKPVCENTPKSDEKEDNLNKPLICNKQFRNYGRVQISRKIKQEMSQDEEAAAAKRWPISPPLPVLRLVHYYYPHFSMFPLVYWGWHLNTADNVSFFLFLAPDMRHTRVNNVNKPKTPPEVVYSKAIYTLWEPYLYNAAIFHCSVLLSVLTRLFFTPSELSAW